MIAPSSVRDEAEIGHVVAVGAQRVDDLGLERSLGANAASWSARIAA